MANDLSYKQGSGRLPHGPGSSPGTGTTVSRGVSWLVAGSCPTNKHREVRSFYPVPFRAHSSKAEHLAFNQLARVRFSLGAPYNEDMHWGILNLFCPMCGKSIRYDGNKVTGTMQHKRFGTLCSKPCFDTAEMKYARMILGKDDDDATNASAGA